MAVLLLAVVIWLATRVVRADQAGVSAALRELGWPTAALSALLAAGGVAVTQRVWAQVLVSLSAPLPTRVGVPVFFVSQLGKYLPGSVWPVLAQMEAGRSQGIARRTMVAANVLTLLVGLAVGTAVACVLLPLGGAESLRRYWWLFAALPLLLALVHPRVLGAVADRAFRLVGAEAPSQRPASGPLLRAGAWSLLSWVLLGGHVAVLVAGLGHGGAAAVLLSVGAIALAVNVGVLALPLPAGAGLREGALVIALSPVLTTPEALVVALTSRAGLVVVDLVLAGLAAVAGVLVRRRAASASDLHQKRSTSELPQ